MRGSGGFRMLTTAVDGVVAVAADSRHRFPRHTHDTFGIGLIDRGAQRSASDRGMVEAGPGDVITVNPGEVHDGAPLDDTGRAWRMLYLEPAVLDDGFAFAEPVRSNPAVRRRFDRLYRAATAAATDDAGLRWEERLLALVAAMRGAGPSGRGVPSGIARSRALIDDDPAVARSLAELAAVAGLGRFQFLRGFRRATGLTPHAYLVQRRIDRARRLVSEGEALAAAAAASGFADQSHMTRLFVRTYGLSPGAYRHALTSRGAAAGGRSSPGRARRGTPA